MLRRPLLLVLAAALLSSCQRAAPEPSDPPPSARASAAPPPSATATAAPPASAAPPLPRVFSPDELDNAIQAELGEKGHCGLVREDASDAAITRPLALVCAQLGKQAERTPLPFSSEQLLAARVGKGRFVWFEGSQPKRSARVWERGAQGEAVEGAFFEYGAAVGETQAVLLTGRMDKRGFVLRADGGKAARLRDGRWSFLSLPAPAEKDWASCFWDVQATPDRDDFVLLQICSAPARPFAYAVFDLAAASDELVRIPFDNAAFDPVRAARGEFAVEADGTIDLGSQSPSHATLARYQWARGAWKTLELRTPTRLASSFVAYGDHVLWTSGGWGEDLTESSDGGATFHEAEPVVGSPMGCNAIGCTFLSMRSAGKPSKVRFRRW